MAAVAPNLVCFGACREASQQMWCNNHTSVVGSIAKPLLSVGWWLSRSGNNNSSRFQGNNNKAREDYYGNNFAGGATSSNNRGVSRLHYCVVAAALAGPRAKDSLLVSALHLGAWLFFPFCCCLIFVPVDDSSFSRFSLSPPPSHPHFSWSLRYAHVLEACLVSGGGRRGDLGVCLCFEFFEFFRLKQKSDGSEL